MRLAIEPARLTGLTLDAWIPRHHPREPLGLPGGAVFEVEHGGIRANEDVDRLATIGLR